MEDLEDWKNLALFRYSHYCLSCVDQVNIRKFQLQSSIVLQTSHASQCTLPNGDFGCHHLWIVYCYFQVHTFCITFFLCRPLFTNSCKQQRLVKQQFFQPNNFWVHKIQDLRNTARSMLIDSVGLSASQTQLSASPLWIAQNNSKWRADDMMRRWCRWHQNWWHS